MSDVSGIPYMGPMGQGNFFAPPYGGGGMNMSAGQIQSAYMPEFANNQNVLNNLYGGGANAGFGQLTNYYSALGANQLSGIGSTNPYGVFSDTGRAAGSPAFDQGAMQNFTLGGGGYNFPSIPDYSGGLGGGAPAINWNTIFQSAGGGLGGSPSLSLPDVQSWAGNWNMPQGGGLSMPGGLNAPMSGSGLDWSGIFGGGAARADPYPNMTMPGGLSSPMTTPQQPYTSGIAPDETGGQTAPSPAAAPQQQPIDFSSLFGQGVGGTGGAPQSPPYTSGIAPDETGGRSFGERFDALGGSVPMGDSAPQSTEPAPLPETSRMSDALLGYTPQQWSDSAYDKPSDPAMDQPLPGNPYTDPQGGGLTATDLSDQARERLAELVAKPTGRTAESAREAGGPVLLAEPPSAADVPRPPADIPPQGLTYLQGKGPGDLRGVNQRFSKALQEFTREYNAGQGDYSIALRSGLRTGPKERLHRTGEAIDINLIDRRTGERLNDYQTRDPVVFRAYQDNANQFHNFLEKNYPELAQMHRWGGYFSGGPGTYGAQDIMHHDLGARIGMAGGSWKGGLGQSSADAYALPTGGGTATPPPQFTFDWSNAPIKDAPPIQLTYKSPGGGSLYQLAPDGTHIPVPMGERMNETTEYDPFRGTTLPTAPSAEAPVEQRPGVNQGQNVAPPPADIPPPAAAAATAPPAPVKHSGLELARANIDTPIEQIAMERGGQKAVDQINFLAMGKTPRQLSQQYGGMFMDRAEPLFKSLGITRQDFDKAAAMPQTKQDIKMRFAAGGDFGPYPEYSGPEAAPGGGVGAGYADFRRSGDVEDLRGELASLQGGEFKYPAGPEVAPTPLSGDLGLSDLPMPSGEVAAAVGPQGFTGGASDGGEFNPLIAQRSGYADTIRDDPNKSLQLAARLYSEEQNNPATRQAILEAMLNRLAASGQDPLNPGYYPKDQTAYNAALAKVSGNNDLLDQIYREMEGPFGGSNTANYATDWASAATAADERKYTTPTWTSPSNEQFFLKDLNTIDPKTGRSWAGEGIIDKNRKWYESVTSPFPR